MSSDSAASNAKTASAKIAANASAKSIEDKIAAVKVTAETEPVQTYSGEKITLKSADGEEFVVDKAVAMEFKTVKAFFDDPADEHDSTVPFPIVRGEVLAKIIGFCAKHVEFRSAKTSDDLVKNFDDDFVKEESDDGLKELVLAANYLDYKLLLDLLNQTIADRIANKSVEFVRAFFGIANDFTPEEEEELRRQNAWAFEGVDED